MNLVNGRMSLQQFLQIFVQTEYEQISEDNIKKEEERTIAQALPGEIKADGESPALTTGEAEKMAEDEKAAEAEEGR